MAKCENCYHFHMCDLQYRLEELRDCEHYKDKSLIVELPCRVGDRVWIALKHIGEICEAMVIGIEYNYYTSPQEWIIIEYISSIIGKHEYKNRTDLMIGKTVFLTREEAERVLEEREKNG